MKNTIVFIGAFLFLNIAAICQNAFSISPDYFSNAYNENLDEVKYLRSKALMKNNSDSILSINWEIINIDIPLEWGLSVSDKDMSYAPGPPFITYNAHPLIFNAAQENIAFNIDIYHNQFTGCGYFEVLITLDEDGSILDTITYDLSINDDDCLQTATENHAFAKEIKVFPNPFNNYLVINTSSTIQHVTLYTLDGKVVKDQAANFQDILVQDVEKGIYFLEIVFEKGQRIVEKVIKTN